MLRIVHRSFLSKIFSLEVYWQLLQTTYLLVVQWRFWKFLRQIICNKFLQNFVNFFRKYLFTFFNKWFDYFFSAILSNHFEDNFTNSFENFSGVVFKNYSEILLPVLQTIFLSFVFLRIYWKICGFFRNILWKYLYIIVLSIFCILCE